MKDKKGAEMTIGTIIVIILAIVVLVVLIYGFTSGWGNLWERLTGFGGGKVNVQSVVDGCKVACSTSSGYDYCTKQRDVVLVANQKAESKRCIDLQGQYGLDACPTIDCTNVNPNNPGKACNMWNGGGWTDGTSICDKNTQVDITDMSTLLLSSDRQPNKRCCVTNMTCTGTPIASDKTCDSGYYDITILLTTAERTRLVNQKCCIQ